MPADSEHDTTVCALVDANISAFAVDLKAKHLAAVRVDAVPVDFDRFVARGMFEADLGHLSHRARDRVLSPEEWETYYDKCPAWFKPFALCLYLTAMRMSEVINLKWEKVDRKTGFIKLSAQETKTSKPRKIPIAPELEEALKGLPRSLTGHVFTRQGEILTPKIVDYWHRYVCRETETQNLARPRTTSQLRPTGREKSVVP